MSDAKNTIDTNLRVKLVDTLHQAIPDIHILVSDGHYTAAAEKLADSVGGLLPCEKYPEVHLNEGALPALTYLASCKTTDEIENGTINRTGADQAFADMNADRNARDKAIEAARTTIAGDLSPFSSREKKLYDALEIAASMIDTSISRRRLGLAGDDEGLREIRSALNLANPSTGDLSGSQEQNAADSADAPFSAEEADIFDSLDPESVHLSRFPREDFGESGATGDDLLAECIVYGYQGSGKATWNNSGSHLGEDQVAWAIRLGRALERNNAHKAREGQAFEIAGNMIAERGYFPSAGAVPYPVTRELIAAAIDPENAPPAGEVKSLLENISNYRNDKDTTLANFGARATQILARKSPS